MNWKKESKLKYTRVKKVYEDYDEKAREELLSPMKERYIYSSFLNNH